MSDTVICAGSSVTLNAANLPFGYLNPRWDFGDGTSLTDSFTVVHAYEYPGTYAINFSADHRVCPTNDTTRFIEVLGVPRVNLPADSTICPNGEPLIIQNLAPYDPASKYVWNTGDSAQHIIVRQDGLYTLTAVNPLGCKAIDSMVVRKHCYIDVPNVFTPNNDGSNDYFFPRQSLSSGIGKFSLKVYNRWGELVYYTQTLDGRGWDGTTNGQPQPQGVYVYLIDVTFVNGVKESYTGNVTMLR
jgi:gliding motility-associated-like protein